MRNSVENRQHWLFCAIALATAVALAWPVFENFSNGTEIRGNPVPLAWFAAFAMFGSAMVAAMMLPLRKATRWILLGMQVVAVTAMATIVNWAMMTTFLMIVSWQVGLETTPRRAIVWTVAQTLMVVAALAQALNPDLCWVIGKAFALQLLLVFTAQALKREVEMARALAHTNRELRSAQTMLAASVRDAERLRISRELHDAWGHELTALGLQLEIASHAQSPEQVADHVGQARALSRKLLGSVRDVVSTLREDERGKLEDVLEELARSVPVPRIHVAFAPGLRIMPDQAHALMRCAQEAVTNSVRHAKADNLWLNVLQEKDGVRLIAEDDGRGRPRHVRPGSGLVGMRERVETLGGRLAAGRGLDGNGFTIDAWLPSGDPRPA